MNKPTRSRQSTASFMEELLPGVSYARARYNAEAKSKRELERKDTDYVLEGETNNEYYNRRFAEEIPTRAEVAEKNERLRLEALRKAEVDRKNAKLDEKFQVMGQVLVANAAKKAAEVDRNNPLPEALSLEEEHAEQMAWNAFAHPNDRAGITPPTPMSNAKSFGITDQPGKALEPVGEQKTSVSVGQ